jgi:structural maintenance of chromosome 4
MTKLNDARKCTVECGQKHSATTESLNAATKASEDSAKKLGSATEKRANAERDDIRLKENLQHSIRNAKKAEESIQKEAMAYAEACGTVVRKNHTSYTIPHVYASCHALQERGKTSVPALEATLVQREDELKVEQAAYDTVLSGLQGETEGLRKAMEAKQRELGPASEAATIVGAKLDTIKTEVRLLRERAEAGGKEIAAVTAQIAEVEKNSVTKRDELEGAKKEQAAMQGRRTDILHDLEATAAAEGKLTEVVKETRSKVEEAKAAFSSEGAGNAVETKLRDAAKKGGPLAAAGFHGRLGDLGAIDAKYDVAISTACGALNWLVVDTAEGAQQCVEYMRAKSLGRAKFICLDKIQWVKDRVDKFSAPASAPRLYDLVRVKDERYRLAFYFALRDTLVAGTLDEASKIAYSGPGGVAAHRVVTLTGELFDTTGTMSGGGKVAKKGGMSASIASSIVSKQ